MSVAVDYRFVLLARLGAILCPDYRFKSPQLDWVHDADFNAYLSRFDELRLFNTERRWNMWQLMRLTEGVPGDTAECGSFQGAGSYLVCNANAGRRHHHIFDSFEGLSEPKNVDGTYWKRGGLACAEDIVARNLSEFTAYTLYKGWIPTRFAEVADRKFSFVHIDVDLYQPTLDSLEFFYPRMSDGGLIVCDDYGFSVCPGATRAVDEFLAGRHEQMISAPCGGGFLIKGIATAKIVRASHPARSGPGSDTVKRPSWSSILFQIVCLVFEGAYHFIRVSLREIKRG